MGQEATEAGLRRFCAACRCLGDSPCAVCGETRQTALEPSLARRVARLSGDQLNGVVLGSVLTVGLGVGTLGGLILMLMGSEMSRALGTLAVMLCAIPLGVLMRLRRRSAVPYPWENLRGVWNRLRVRTIGMRAERPRLVLPAATGRLAFTGRLVGDGVLVRAELWFAPDAPREPVAWRCDTPGFAVETDDGQRVEVPAGPLGLEPPEELPLSEPGGGTFLVIHLALRAGERVSLHGAAERAAAGYREASGPWRVRGVATVRPLPVT